MDPITGSVKIRDFDLTPAEGTSSTTANDISYCSTTVALPVLHYFAKRAKRISNTLYIFGWYRPGVHLSRLQDVGAERYAVDDGALDEFRD